MSNLKSVLHVGLGLSILALVTVSALAASDSKPDASQWDNLKQLAPGDGIRIVLNDMKSYAGQFQSVSDDAIVVRLTSGDQTLSRESVLRVSTKGQSHRGRNALIGAAIGASVGVIANFAYGEGVVGHANCAHLCVDPLETTGSAVGAGLAGAGVGALIPTGGWHDVYRAR